MTAITGNTFPVRVELRNMGGQWNAGLKDWMVPDSVAIREEVPEMAQLCRRTAESIRIEARTGRVTCVCHLKPVEECYGRLAR